jgi:hypothetical protein
VGIFKRAHGFGSSVLGPRPSSQMPDRVTGPRLAVSLQLMYYNFVRIHQTLRITPATAAGATDHVWDIAKLLEDRQEGRIAEGW